MYRYDEFDHAFVQQRVAQFRDQVARRIVGEITEDEFKPLRLMNGLYLQLHAYMLRIGIPYGMLSSVQLRKLAHIARKYDRGYGHFTTRQCIQFNWLKLEDTPDILAELAEVQMHAYMLRVAVPYGVLSARQLRCLADISRRYDRGYGHITTRQNIQFNWIELAEMPDLENYILGMAREML